MPDLPDFRPLLVRALDQTGDLITGTDGATASDPTPCTDYDVATLIAHLHAVCRRIAAVVRGEPFDSVPRIWPAEDAVVARDPGQWSALWQDGQAELQAVLSDADLAKVVTLPWGDAPLGAALASYVGELAVHDWDLAVATGRRDRLDPALAEAALPATLAKVPADRSADWIPFGPVVEVPDDAPAYDRLVGWVGRDPAWRP